MPAQTKPKSSESRRDFFFLSFLPRADVPHVYVHAWTVCFFHSLISTQNVCNSLTASVDRCGEINSNPSVA